MPRAWWVLLVTFAALLAVVLAPRSKGQGPFVPASADEVVETVAPRGRAPRAPP